jgi:hypothetical protein
MTVLQVQQVRRVFRVLQEISVQPEQAYRELQVQQAHREFKVI